VQNNWSAIASPLHFLNKMSNQDMTASPFRGGPLGQEWHQHLLHQHLPMCKHLLLHHHLTMCKLLLLPHHRQLYFLWSCIKITTLSHLDQCPLPTPTLPYIHQGPSIGSVSTDSLDSTAFDQMTLSLPASPSPADHDKYESTETWRSSGVRQTAQRCLQKGRRRASEWCQSLR